jgi:hypothetical protein
LFPSLPFLPLPFPVLKSFLDSTTPFDKVTGEEFMLGLSTEKGTKTIRVEEAPEECLTHSYSGPDSVRQQQGQKYGIDHDKNGHQVRRPENVEVFDNDQITPKVGSGCDLFFFIVVIGGLAFRKGRRIVSLVDIWSVKKWECSVISKCVYTSASDQLTRILHKDQKDELQSMGGHTNVKHGIACAHQ